MKEEKKKGRPLGTKTGKQVNKKPASEIDSIIEKWDELCNYCKCFATQNDIIVFMKTSRATLLRAISQHTKYLYKEEMSFARFAEFCRAEREMAIMNNLFNSANKKGAFSHQVYVYEEFIKPKLEKEKEDNSEAVTNVIILNESIMNADDFNKIAIESQKQVQTKIDELIKEDEEKNKTTK